jgi:UDP-N-acetylglucosamine pyrophosphorylase
MENRFNEFELKMRAAGVSDFTLRAFRHNYAQLIDGDTGQIPESSIQAVKDLLRLEEIPQGSGLRHKNDGQLNPALPSSEGDSRLLAQTVVLKLNGGLGTSMGLERAKSLLVVRDGLSFLDFTVRQINWLRSRYGSGLRFLLMNSFTTSADTLEFLKKFPELGKPESLELMQSQVPKVEAQTLLPISWPANPTLEWCPPGHGDLYPSILGSGILGRLLDEGAKYLFVSNSDNLGADLDVSLLTHFARSGQDFMMEVAERTPSDRKGGHLAQRDGKLILRESAQCAEADVVAFQDIQRHRFFNTNNLWIRLDSIQALLDQCGGFIPLPLIKNAKTVDPRDKHSPLVFQLETAMGAAIEKFPNAGAIIVPRTRFAPVKTTADLFALRSDAYTVTENWRILLANLGTQPPPAIDLDSNHYRLVDQLDAKLAAGVPSLKDCRELKVRGPVLFQSGNVFRGKVSITNDSSEARLLPAGEYCDCSVEV